MRAADFPMFAPRWAAFAHRGGAGHPDLVGKENTLAAFQHAVGMGYRYLEIDVHATLDDELVVFHDDDLRRIAGAPGAIADRTFAEVSALRVGGSEHIPSLDEVLETFPETRFNIDLKNQGAVAALVRAIDRHRAHDRVCVASFSVERLREFRRLMGRRVPTSVSPLGVAWNGYVPLVPRLLNSPGTALQVPLTQQVGRRSVPVLTQRLLRHAHLAGKVVHVWTIDDPLEMHRLLDMGVDGIVSDRTDLLKQVFVERGIWEDR
ncbi:MAG TPA: glycerophosphodiester phosphodiesterase [Propionibacteriaceae bacterium]|nr:glycerophosphodiester phosphodiesterase [Propionibacteriaceae bacterium]